MAISGSYGAAREMYPPANTVLSAFNQIQDREGLLLMFQTYSTDIWNMTSHNDESTFIGWDSFVKNCQSIADSQALTIPPPGSEYDPTYEALSALQGCLQKYHPTGIEGTYNDVKETAGKVVDAVEQAVKDAMQKAKDSASTAGWILAAIVIGAGFIMYTSAKHGGGVNVI